MAVENNKILIVEDNVIWCESYKKWIGDEYEIKLAFNKTEALELCRSFEPDLIILDLGLPNIKDGFDLLDEIIKMGKDWQIIVVTSFKDHQYALEAQKRGAYSYFSKGENIEEELPYLVKQALRMQRLERENKELRSKLRQNIRYDDIVAVSRQMQEILSLIEQIKDSKEPVLITGESGVGKEVVARHIFKQNSRYNKNFVAINCAALPAHLLESELFGYEKGAFTGATKTTRGKIELAHEGTLFLDEIGDLPLELQGKLLRVLEEKRFYRLGGEKEIEVDFRLISATNHSLSEMVKEGKFREDLYYRINVIPIHIPPLRERPDDIPAMVEYFSEKFCRENNLPKPKFTNRVIAFLSHLQWEGNARELENTIKRLILLNRQQIDIQDLPPDIIEESNNFLDKALANELSLEEVSRIYVKMVLDLKKGNKKEACKLLKINYRTLMRKLNG
ncbi:MAG: sigma-54-dependent Fis family transcriptional regulator [Calditrichaeota bacterium]|nr:sigma-54-dependent Fis family transcriptional regulator [Calditrichota bacterium]